jgi:citrate synthase
MYAAVSARIGALEDPPQGGAGAVARMLSQIAIPDNARPWLEEALADGRPIAGFGAGKDENSDCRVSAMRAALGMIAALRGAQDILDVYDAVAAVSEAEGLYPGLDYPTGLACHLIGFDASALSCVLAAARLPSWTARIAGQHADISLAGS